MQISRWRRGKTSPGRRARNETGFGRVIPGRRGGGPALTAGPRGSREQRGGEFSHRDDIWLFPVNAGEKERIRARDARWQRIHREKLISKCGGSAEKKRRKSRNSKKKKSKTRRFKQQPPLPAPGRPAWCFAVIVGVFAIRFQIEQKFIFSCLFFWAFSW